MPTPPALFLSDEKLAQKKANEEARKRDEASLNQVMNDRNGRHILIKELRALGLASPLIDEPGKIALYNHAVELTQAMIETNEARALEIIARVFGISTRIGD